MSELDAELKALRAVVRALEPLSETERRRVIAYLHEALAAPNPETQPAQPSEP